jgi:predicted dehydrogenase
MGKKVKWGILGYAGIARKKVLPAMKNLETVELYAIASRDQKKLQDAVEQYQFEKTYSSYDELLLDPEVQAVYIPLPNALHKEWVIKAANAGKHILCEKPLALTKEDALEMVEACEKNHVKLMEAFMYRFSSRSKKLKELINTGVIGEIKHINSSHRFVLSDMENVRASQELGGGSLHDVGCYPINMVGLLLQDEPESICAQKIDFHGVDFAISAVLKYKNGVMASIHSGFDTHSSQITEIDGTKGSIILRDSFIDMDGVDTPILVALNDGSEAEYMLTPCRQYEAEVEEFSNAILEDRDPEFSLTETVRNVHVMDEILRCAK